MASSEDHWKTRELPTNEELAAIVAGMRVADPTQDNGAFSSLTKKDILLWLFFLGADGLASQSGASLPIEELIRRLRLGLWDVQRIDNIFPGKAYSHAPKLNIQKLPTWRNWNVPKTELRSMGLGPQQFDMYKDKERLDSCVFRDSL
jgi:hypothetical protein